MRESSLYKVKHSLAQHHWNKTIEQHHWRTSFSHTKTRHIKVEELCEVGTKQKGTHICFTSLSFINIFEAFWT